MHSANGYGIDMYEMHCKQLIVTLETLPRCVIDSVLDNLPDEVVEVVKRLSHVGYTKEDAVTSLIEHLIIALKVTCKEEITP